MTETTQTRERPSWIDAKTFEDGDYAVRVQKLDVRAPRFSISIGRQREGKFIPHLPVMTEGQGKVTVQSLYAKIGLLVQQAEVWIQEQVQRHEDERLAYKLQYEERDANRDRPKTRHTGKTERDRNKTKAKAA